jgi:hypothetical protein
LNSRIAAGVNIILSALLVLAAAGVAGEETRPEASAAFPLSEHTARYAVFRRGREIGYLDLELRRRADGDYEYSLNTTATALLARMLGLAAHERGRFGWDDGQISPLSYAQLVERPGRNRFWEAEFNWRALEATGQSHHGPLSVGLMPGVLDPLTLRLQLAVQLAADGAPRAAYEFQVLERDGIETQSFVLRDKVLFEYAARCVPAVRMERLRGDPSRSYSSWHARAFEWMPVRIQQFSEGREELDLRLRQSSLPLATEECP